MERLSRDDLYSLLDSEGIYPWIYDEKKEIISFFTSTGPWETSLTSFIKDYLTFQGKKNTNSLIDLLKGVHREPLPLQLNLPFMREEEWYNFSADTKSPGKGHLKRTESNESWKMRGFEIIDTLPLGVLIKDIKDQSRYLYSNPRLVELHAVHEKIEDMIGHTDRDLYTKEEAQQYQKDDWKAIKQGRCTYIGQFTAHDRDSTIIDTYKIPLFDKEGNPDLIIAIMEDVSETVKIRDELHQSRKMEAMGMLAGGMAHDFNNMLTGIMGYADLVLSGFSDDHPHREYMKVILASSQQAASLANTLLSFSRKQKMKIKRINLPDIVNEACTILARTIDKRISINNETENLSLFIKGDQTQILNILLNLGLNSKDAMPKGGCITIKIERLRLEESCMRKLNLEFHNYICLSFSDTGSGIPREIIDKVFDPFFSTKELGKGTGLGLSSVYSSMKKLEGTVELISEEHKGTTFNLYFCPWED